MNAPCELQKLERQLTILIGTFALFGVYLIGVSVLAFFIFAMPERGIDPSYESQLTFRHLFTVNMFIFIPANGIGLVLTSAFLRNYRRQKNRLAATATS